MNFNYNEQEYEEFPNFKGGEKSLYAKMFHDEKNRIIYGKLIPGASIGVHTHETNSEIIYITKGTGRVLMDGEYEKRMYNGLISMNFLQIRKMEEIEMEVLRSDFYQLMRLFENEERHKEEQTNEVAKEAVEMYKRFISMKDYIYYKEMQRERLWVESRRSEEREYGREEGLAQGKSEETLRRACQIIFNKYKGEDLEWLKSCTQEQLDYAFDIVFKDIDYETFKKMICHYH